MIGAELTSASCLTLDLKLSKLAVEGLLCSYQSLNCNCVTVPVSYNAPALFIHKVLTVIIESAIKMNSQIKEYHHYYKYTTITSAMNSLLIALPLLTCSRV